MQWRQHRGLIRNIRDNPAVLVSHPAKELRVLPGRPHRSPRDEAGGSGRGSFIDSVREAVDTFHGKVLQHIKAWTAAPHGTRDPRTTPPLVALSS